VGLSFLHDLLFFLCAGDSHGTIISGTVGPVSELFGLSAPELIGKPLRALVETLPHKRNRSMSAAASAGATKSWFFVALFFLPLGCRVAIFTDRNVEISFIAIGNGSSHQHKAQKRSADPCHVDIICG
jgi:hypothetical protein